MKNKFLSCFFLATLLSSQTAFSDSTRLELMTEDGGYAEEGENYSLSKGRCQSRLLTKTNLLIAAGSITTLAVIATAAASIWANSPSSEADQPIDLGQCENFYNQWMINHGWLESHGMKAFYQYKNFTAQYKNMTEDVKTLLERIGLSRPQIYISPLGFPVELPVFFDNSSVHVNGDGHLVNSDGACFNLTPQSLKNFLGLSDLNETIAAEIWKNYKSFPHQVQGVLYEIFQNSRDILTQFMPSKLIPSSFKESWDNICWDNICRRGEIARAFVNRGQLIGCNFKDSCTDTVTKIVTRCVEGTLMACERLQK